MTHNVWHDSRSATGRFKIDVTVLHDANCRTFRSEAKSSILHKSLAIFVNGISPVSITAQPIVFKELPPITNWYRQFLRYGLDPSMREKNRLLLKN